MAMLVPHDIDPAPPDEWREPENPQTTRLDGASSGLEPVWELERKPTRVSVTNITAYGSGNNLDHVRRGKLEMAWKLPCDSTKAV